MKKSYEIPELNLQTFEAADEITAGLSGEPTFEQRVEVWD